MSCFTTMSAVTAASEFDLTKHVNYTAGMILGVDDFTQEFAYLSGRDRWMAREALGYGTVSGLLVRVENDEGDPRVMVEPGVAITPRGQLACVSTAQCAYLNQWLAAAKSEDLTEWIQYSEGSPPDANIKLYVVLCYRDCLTDDVPIPGEPCRNENELMASSRVKDDFSLELRFEAPKQPEEDAVRRYSDFLKQILISDEVSSTPLDKFLDSIRDEFLPVSPPRVSPPVTLQIHPDDVEEYIRLAFRLWTTELRNVLSEKETGCAVEMTGGGKIEDCILLAELRIPLESFPPNWKVSDEEEIELTEENRPFLLHLRMLQEWMLNEPNDHGHLTGLADDDHKQYLLINGSRAMTGNLVMGNNRITALATATVKGDAVNLGQLISGDLEWKNSKITIANLQSKPVAATTPAEGQVLIFKGGKWIPEKQDHGELNGLADDDHPQYLLINGTRPMTGDLKMGGKKITGLAQGTANGDAVIFEQAIKKDDAAGGDLTDKYPNPTIAKLQGKTVSATMPTDGHVLTYRVDKWVPEKPAPGGVTDHGALTGLADDDHPQYLLINGTRAMTGDLKMGSKKVTGLLKGTVAGDAVVFEQVVKTDDLSTGDLSGTYSTLKIAKLQGKPIDTSNVKDAQILRFRTDKWVPEDLPPSGGGGVTDHSALTGLANDDHKQYLHLGGSRAMTGILKLGNNRISGISKGTIAGDAVIFEQAIKVNDAAGGDLSSNYPNPTISKLQGRTVKADNPSLGDILVYNGVDWVTQAVQLTVLPLATITRTKLNTYEIWFNIDAPNNLVEIEKIILDTDLIVEGENKSMPFLSKIPGTIAVVTRNVFTFTATQGDMDYMRFTFFLGKITLKSSITLAAYAKVNSIRFMGSVKDETATIFVRKDDFTTAGLR